MRQIPGMNEKTRTQILTDDFDSFSSQVAGEVWNRIVHEPGFHGLEPAHYIELLDAVRHALKNYHT